MGTDDELEVHRNLRDAQSRYVYFLLSVAGAAIAFAVTQTRGLALSWSQVPLGIAVLSWGFSFYSGCRNITWSTASLHTNAELLQVGAGRHPIAGTNLQAIEVGLDALNKCFCNQSDHANSWWKRQFAALATGTVFYVVWHVLEMGLQARA